MCCPEHTQAQRPSAGVSPRMMAGITGYTLLLRSTFVVVGVRVRQRWLAFWGATRVLAGGAYMVALLLGLA